MKIKNYNKYLVGCRFCPMCKPFGEVSNITKDETHSTRVRGMLLWQIANEKTKWDDATIKLIFESTLDSVSQAFCVNHYPVPEYMVAARMDIVEANLEPECVRLYEPAISQSIDKSVQAFSNPDAEVLFYPGDALSANYGASTNAITQVLSRAEVSVKLPDRLSDCGGLAYCLGKIDQARECANNVTADFSGCNDILVDGPMSYWMLTKIYPELGINLPENTKIKMVTDTLNELQEQNKLANTENTANIYLLGSEFSRLTEPGYAPFRKLMKSLSKSVIESYDGLELAEGSGAGGGLHITSPHLAKAVSEQRVLEAIAAGAEWLVCDSPLDNAHLKLCSDEKINIGTPAEFLLS